ncbi:MAG: hypothetical protein KIT09_13460 [Bryobacteraceae bacterium]|nr:hypothetical protein [Bryobacteraceae bacterium]
MKIQLFALCVLTMLGLSLKAQAPGTGRALSVEHAVPFGTIAGKLLLVGNYLVFVDEQQPEASFVVSKGAIERLTAEGAEITVLTRDSVRNRTGEVKRLSFRVAPGTDPALVTGWYGTGVSASAPAAPPSPSAPASGGDVLTYSANHNHRIGECRGRLIVTPDQVSFESVESISHSRRWDYRSIREIKMDNPYQIEIRAFTGGNYKIRLEGDGMDPDVYKTLVDRVAMARAGR